MDVTGYYGEYTAQAVANFQNQNSLDSTGIVDEKTYNALFSDNAVANPKTEVVSGEVSPAVSAAPIEMPSSTGASQFILSNEKNQNYSDTASSDCAEDNCNKHKPKTYICGSLNCGNKSRCACGI